MMYLKEMVILVLYLVAILTLQLWGLLQNKNNSTQHLKKFIMSFP